MAKAVPKICRFRLKEVAGTWRAKACRCALTELLGAAGNDPIGSPEYRVEISREGTYSILRQYKHLLLAWRARLAELRQAGWGPIRDPTRFVFANNCPPAGVMVNRGIRTCKRAQVCPWCWCRDYVMAPFDRLSQFLYPDGGSRVGPYDLFEIHYRRYCHVPPWTLADVTELGQTLRLQRRLPGQLGAYSLTSLEPPLPGKDPRYLLHTRVLYVLPHDCPAELAPSRQGDYLDVERSEQRISAPRRLDLVLALGRVARYPRRLFTGGVNQTVQVLHARPPGPRVRSVRAAEFYGCLRGLKPVVEPIDDITLIDMETVHEEAWRTPSTETRETPGGADWPAGPFREDL